MLRYSSTLQSLDVRGVMVKIGGNGHGFSSSNPGWGWLHFT